MYPKSWLKKSESAKSWQRSIKQLNNLDRMWLYCNSESPILDVGCGNCVDEEYFEKYVGIDVTLPFLKICKKTVICSDAKYLPFRSKSFKTVYAKDLLLHYPQNEGIEMIYEMLRVGETVYVAWGIGGEDFNRGTDYVPSEEPFTSRRGGFWYNRYDIRDLEKEFNIIRIGKGTSITLVKSK